MKYAFRLKAAVAFLFLVLFYNNCSGNFTTSSTNSLANSVTSTLPTGSLATGQDSGAGSASPSIPKGPVPPVPPDVLPSPITPVWFGAHLANEWFAIPNSIHAGSPAAPTDNPNDPFCFSTRRLAYSGIAQKGTQIILAATGGHDDYSGNEVTSIDLADANPSWRQLQAATPVAQRIQDVPYFLDGLPNSRHTYNTVFFSTTRNRLVLHRSRFMWASAVSSNDTNGFNLDNNTWDPAGSYNPGMSPMARDSHDNVWASSNYFELWKWTATTDTWTKTGTFANQVGTGMAHDSRRDQLYQLSWGDGQGNVSGVWSYLYNIDGTIQTPITIQDSSAYQQFIADTPANATMIYDPDGDRYLFWDGISSRLYQITPNSSTTWQMSILVTTGATPPVASYSFGRMAYVPALRGIVIMPSGHQSLYFLRLN